MGGGVWVFGVLVGTREELTMNNMYVYCSRPSESAFELAKQLEGIRLRKFDGMHFWKRGKRLTLPERSKLVCWGAALPEIPGIDVLNGGPVVGKGKAALLFNRAKIPSVKVWTDCRFGRLKPEALPRLNNHVGGNDLLNPPDYPDFYVLKENLVAEYRIHSFFGKSIRAGVKVPRDIPPGNVHPWIRSFDGGWRINYDQFKSSKQMRLLAAKAVKALGLQFGAVDLGLTYEGVLMVLEVNRAPGSEGGTLDAYKRAISGWAEKPPEKIVDNPADREADDEDE